MQQRKAQSKARNQVERLVRRDMNAPTTVDVTLSTGVTVLVPLSEQFAPVLELAEDTRLLDMAIDYDLPISRQQQYLLAEGDTYLQEYEKIELTEEEQLELVEQQWSPVMSSNIKAVKIDGNDLLIWFHSGDKYRYPDEARMYAPFNEALSPGRLLWRTIRTKRGYAKI